jgi:hypothetical protein
MVVFLRKVFLYTATDRPESGVGIRLDSSGRKIRKPSKAESQSERLATVVVRRVQLVGTAKCGGRSGGVKGRVKSVACSPDRSICVVARVGGKESRGKLGRHPAPVSLSSQHRRKVVTPRSKMRRFGMTGEKMQQAEKEKHQIYWLR